MPHSHRVMDIEPPDDGVIVTFLKSDSKRKKDRRGCNVVLTVENGSLRVQVTGCDDRCTVLCDESYELPEEDHRH